MSMKSMMMMPPRLRSLNSRAMVWQASRLVRKMVSSKLRVATKPPVVHVYRGHGFGGLDNQVAAEVEVDARLQGAADFLFDVVGFKQRAFAFE